MSKRKPDIAFEPASFDTAEFEAATFTAAGMYKPDPLAEIPYTGDPETDSAAELTAIRSAFAQRATNEDKRRQKATDSEYWVCMCFQTREQVEAFLRATKWGAPDAKYIDGCRVAAKLGVPIPGDDTGYGRVKIDPKWAALSLAE